MRRVLSLSIFLALISLSPFARAQALSVQTSLSEPLVAVGDVVTMQVTVTARVAGKIQVNVPKVDGMTELSRQQSQSQSLSWSSAGQQVLVQNVYTIDYRADRPGRYVLGPVTARIGKRKAKSTTVKLTIEGEGAIKKNAAPAKANKVVEPDPVEGKLFLRYRVNRSKPYLGQEIFLDLEVISEPNQNFQVEETTGLPEAEGFWTQILEQPRRLQPKRITIKGRQYISYRIWRAALYPLTAGELTVPPVSMSFSQGASLFSTGRRFRRRTRPLKIEVRPLPSEGRPSDFVSTNVGRYRLTATVDQRKVPAGKALIYKLRLSGKGNITSAKLPTVGEVAGFRVFAPTVRDDVKADAKGIRGFKEAEYLLMPLKGGLLTIPKVEMSTFNPAAGKYRRLQTKPIRIRVDGTPDPNAATPDTPVTIASASPAKAEMRPLRFESDLSPLPPTPWNQGWFWLLLFAPGAASGGAFALRWSRLRQGTPSARVVQQIALKQSMDQLDLARADIDAGNLADAHAKIADALRQGGTQAFGLSMQGLTFEAISKETTARGLRDEDAKDLVRLLEAAAYARYAPSRLSEMALRADLERAEQLLETFRQLSTEVEA